MRAILIDMKSGDLNVHEIPAPELRPGGILVRTAFSAISAGTERATIETGKKSLLGKALARPDLVKQVLEHAKANGFRASYQKVRGRLDTLSPLGYSCSGIVLAVGDRAPGFHVGDRVACGGASYATHSEINFVPCNLAVKMPAEVSLEVAALSTIGAIAIQGIRQAHVSFGETVAVVGAGLVGALSIQLARAAGCRVIAIDADHIRAERAVDFGAHLGLVSSDERLLEKATDFSRYGVDAAIVTAAADSAAPVELAAQLLRDRGRIVVVGAVDLGVSRAIMYQKELSLVLSRSYGPGRYDRKYEELGQDYPLGHVRWTEQRNMEAFLDLVSTGAVRVDPLLERRYAIEDGARAYTELRSSGAYTAILEYPQAAIAALATRETRFAPQTISGDLRIGCIGAGSFARGVIFPELRAMKNVVLQSVATASGAAAISARTGFSFRAAEAPNELIANPEIGVVFVLSRHDSHATYVLSLMEKGKPVFVEKPLATDRAQLESIQQAYQEEMSRGRTPFVMVGFNRRFAQATEAIRTFFAGRREPMVVQIRVNAGYLPRDHWTQQDANGGRIVGEFCHFLDWARCVIGARILTLHTTALPDGSRYNGDNVAVTASFADGSIANFLYLANGDKCVAKEFYEVFCEGSVARLDDFRRLELVHSGKRRRVRCHRDKGHRRELELTLAAIREGLPAPIPFDEIAEVTAASFAVRESLNSGLPVGIWQASPEEMAVQP